MITLGVSNLERSIQFYEDGLGLPRHEWDGDIAFFETASTWLALYPREALADDAGVSPQGDGFTGFTLAHNVRSQDEVDRLMETAASIGAEIVKPAEEKPWGGYSGYFSDPDGFLWEVAWNPFFSVEE